MMKSLYKFYFYIVSGGGAYLAAPGDEANQKLITNLVPRLPMQFYVLFGGHAIESAAAPNKAGNSRARPAGRCCIYT